MDNKKDKKSKKDKNGSKSTPVEQPSTYVPKPVGPVPMTALQQTVESEVTRNWINKPFARFPIHKDLPRFIRTTYVVDSRGNSIYQPNKEETQAQAIARLLMNLANIFEPSNIEKFNTGLESLKRSDKVDTESMSLVFQAIDDIDDVSSPTLKLLKSCNQGILAPALVNLQLSFMGTKFMFVDINWNILIQVSDHHVKVEHRRYEGFSSGTGHFGWATTFLIARSDMSLISVRVRVFDYRIPDKEIEAEWMSLIKPIYEVDTLKTCNDIFNKPWDRLPIAKDLVRFASNTVFLLGNETVAISSLSEDSLAHLKLVLIQFATLFKEDELIEKINNTFEEHVLKLRSSDLNAVIKSWMVDELGLNAKSPTTRLCKLFTQSILAPLATNLQIGLNHLTPVKDGSTWTISVSLVPSGVIVKHTKQQMTINRTDPSKCFDFTWTAQFTVNTLITEIESIRGVVTSITFPLGAQLSEAVQKQTKEETESLLNLFLN